MAWNDEANKQTRDETDRVNRDEQKRTTRPQEGWTALSVRCLTDEPAGISFLFFLLFFKEK